MIKIHVRCTGRHLTAMATAPHGYSWNGCHELIEDWRVDGKSMNRMRQNIRTELERRLVQMGDPTPCSETCECRDDS